MHPEGSDGLKQQLVRALNLRDAHEPSQALSSFKGSGHSFVATCQSTPLSAGAVHEGKLYVPHVSSQDGGADLSTFNFDSREWSSLSCNEPRPAGCLEQLLAVHGDVLIYYGRKPWQPACLRCYALPVYEALNQMYCKAARAAKLSMA